MLYFPYQTVLQAFGEFGIDAHFDEGTSEVNFEEKVSRYYGLSDQTAVARKLVEINHAEVEAFLKDLEVTVSRRVNQVHVLPLHGSNSILSSVNEAICFIADYAEATGSTVFTRYEIIVRFSNGSEIIGKFQSKAEALEFLAAYA